MIVRGDEHERIGADRSPRDRVEPSNSVGPDPLPEIWQADLDAMQVEELLRLIAASAAEVEVVIRGRDGAPGPCAEPPSLRSVAASLAVGRGVRLCYRHDGIDWIDTLLPRPGGARLIRAARR